MAFSRPAFHMCTGLLLAGAIFLTTGGDPIVAVNPPAATQAAPATAVNEFRQPQDTMSAERNVPAIVVADAKLS